jgi:polysaccharide biosynthesis protein PelD
MEDRVQDNRTYIAGLRLSAVIEIVLFFVIMLVMDAMGMDGKRFWGVEPHPYWIIVLLISSQYGTAEGVLAVIVASLALLLGNMPQQQLDQDMYAYLFHVSIHPLLWVVAAVSLGELRNRHIRERDILRVELELANEREEKITESYEWVRDHKQKLELRIAGQFRSSIDTYKAAKSIEKLDPQDVLHGVQELVRAILNPEKFSVYLLDKDGLQATIMHGWTAEDNYLRTIDSTSRIYEEIVGRKQVLCAANDEHERVIAGEGVLVGPLLNTESGDIIGMLKIEQMAFSDLNLSTVEAFRSICEWIGMAFVNAGKYQDAKSSSLLNPDHNLLTSNYFTRHTDYISALAKRLDFSVAMVVVRVVDANKLDAAVRASAARKLSQAADAVLRSIDLAFDYQEVVGEYSIVLPATDRKGARIVQEKIEKVLAERGRELSAVVYSFTVHMIHEK